MVRTYVLFSIYLMINLNFRQSRKIYLKYDFVTFFTLNILHLYIMCMCLQMSINTTVFIYIVAQ